MKFGYPVIVLSCFLSLGSARGQEEKGRAPRSVVTVDSMFSSYPKLEAQAREIGEAFVRKDYQRYAQLTFPRLIQIAGGKQNFVKAITAEVKQEEAQGLQVLSSTPTDVTQFLKVSGSLYAVMPITQRMKMRGELFESYGCLIGISSDKGEHWTFLDPGTRGVKDILPNVADKISLCPEKRPRKLTDN